MVVANSRPWPITSTGASGLPAGAPVSWTFSWMPLTATSVMLGNLLVPETFGHPLDQWLERAPVLADRGHQLGGVDHLVEPVRPADRDRLVPQQLDPGVVGVVAAR